jgi:hypothetical protein
MSFAHSQSPECRVPSRKAHGGYRLASGRCSTFSSAPQGPKHARPGHRPGELAFPESPSPARAQHSRYRSTVLSKPCAALSGHGPIMAPCQPGRCPGLSCCAPLGQPCCAAVCLYSASSRTQRAAGRRQGHNAADNRRLLAPHTVFSAGTENTGTRRELD